MSDKKMTVAELLARAGKDGSSEDKPRRRRRRSLEDGGISVAELTGSIPTVEAKPAESRHSSVPIDTPSEAKLEPKETVVSQDAVEVKQESKPKPKPVVAAKPEAKIKTASTPKLAPNTPAPAKTEPKPKLKADPTPKEKTGPPKRPSPGADETVTFDKVESDKPEVKVATKNDETGVIPATPAVAPKPGAEASSAVVTASSAIENDDAPDADKQDADGDSSEETTSVTGVILLAIIGVVLGVVVFKGFELLWESLSRPIVAVLAIVVTAAIVGVVKLLRTNNDGLSMALATVVGAIMTFGPLIIIML